MTLRDYNNDFFGWNGTIGRKNYAINMFIVCFLALGLSFVNFEAFKPFISFDFLLSVVIFMAELLRLILLMCALSLVYRRIMDFSNTKPYKFQLNIKRFFIFAFVVPILYVLCLRHFASYIPVLMSAMDFIIGLILIPISIISSIVFCFIKSI